MDLHKCYLTANECYKKRVTMTPCGVMVHSTAANNPNLRRYVQPDDGLLGKNLNGNSWNQFRPGGNQVCCHAFIGKLQNGSIATYQTLPWNVVGWHCGGSANRKGYIGFEICEDGLADSEYFSKVYKEAVELTAYLCKLYKLDPMKKGVVICHSEGYKLGIASNHADVMHWFPKHGKNMDIFRSNVQKAMKEEDDMDEATVRKIVREEFSKILSEREAEPVSKEFVTSVNDAMSKGITDGSAPKAFSTREQVITMIMRAISK